MHSKLAYSKDIFLDFPKRIMGTPFKGFDEMKTEKRGSMVYAVSMLVLSSLLAVFEKTNTGFIFSFFNPYTTNSLFFIITNIFPILLFTLANWSVTSLTNGSGKMKEIFMVVMYAMYPLIIAKTIALILSNVLTIDENMLIVTIKSLGGVLFVFYAFVGLVVIHEYGFFQGIGAILLTIVSMMIIVFVLLLLSTLAGDFIMFVITVFKELMLKYM